MKKLIRGGRDQQWKFPPTAFKQQKYLGKDVLTGMEKDSLTWIGQLVFLEKLNAQFDLREN